MSAIENIISMIVLIGLLVCAFVIITGMNIKFFTDVTDYSIKEYDKEKYGNDLDAILSITEPVSKDSYANILADAVYYRKKSFEYPEPAEVKAARLSDPDVNKDISFYYNNSVSNDKNSLQADKLMQLTFEKLYGKDNFYLEIAPLIIKLRLYFVIDGSTSLENETAELKKVIPNLLKDFNSDFEVVSRVFILADGGLDRLDPCDELKKYTSCTYLHKEELYSNQVSNGWLKAGETSTESLNHIFTNWQHLAITNNPVFSTNRWLSSPDEFLDESDATQQKAVFFCSWIDINKSMYKDFKLQLRLATNIDNAAVRVNNVWHDAQNNTDVSVFSDLNNNSKWQSLCIAYRPKGTGAGITYKYSITDQNNNVREDYFKQKELFAFRSRPSEFSFLQKTENIDLNYYGGIYYEDWASASAYAAITAEKENPSTLTVIIPISDELSLGSEAIQCETMTGFARVFCERCNKAASAAITALKCPTERSGKDVNNAIEIIKPFGYSVFPVLANSCDIESPYTDESNLTCANFFTPYGNCMAQAMPVCGQCFGPVEMECPGLTLENPSAGIFSSKGCDKKQCRDFIKEQMTDIATKTGGKMILLTEIQKLKQNISTAIKETIEQYKITAGVKKTEEQRFVFQKLVPLSNNLYANFKFWHYNNALQR